MDSARSRTPSLVLVCAFLIALSACSGGGGKTTAQRQSLSGRVIAPDCASGYDVENAQVVVHNQTNEIIGTSSTGANLLAPLKKPCIVTFRIPNVPTAKFYTLEIGTHAGPAWSSAQLNRQHFHADLTLGDVALPTFDEPTFCTTADSLNSLMFDTDTLDNHSSLWGTQYRGYLDTLTTSAGGLVLGGKQDEGSRLAVMVASLQKVAGNPGFTSAREFDNAYEPANSDMESLMSDVGCSQTWASVHYDLP